MRLDWRDALGTAIFCGGIALIAFWFGYNGIVAGGLTMIVIWLTIGVAYGWWIGQDEEADGLIAELMRRLKLHRAQRQGSIQSQKQPLE